MEFRIIIDTIFGAALFVNAILFIPQALKIYQQKRADSISFTMFFGFLVIQLSAVLYGVVHHDMLLMYGYILSAVCCGSVILLAASYRKSRVPNKDSSHIHLLEDIIAKMPGNVYWVDTNNVYQGCNDNMAKLAGLKSRHDIVGKRNSDLPWNFEKPELAKQLDKANHQAMTLGKILTIEEPGTALDGTTSMYLSNKVPLKDEQGLILGMVGISTDITNQKKIGRRSPYRQRKSRSS